MTSACYYTIIACWVFFLAYWIVSARRLKPAIERQSRWSSLAHRVPLGLGYMLLWFGVLPYPLSLALTPRTDPARILGAVLCVLGLIVTIWSRRTLAGNWSSDVTFKQEHQLIQTGPYRFARHPIYTGLLLMCLGTAVARGFLHCWLGFLIMSAAFYIKLTQEESLLLRHFPADYPSYQSRVKALVPFLFAFASVFLCGSARASDPFLAAADFSDLAFFESLGVTYKDGGQVQDGLAILKRHGLNCVRLRLFTSSAAQAAADPYNYTNNLTYNLPLALRVKNAGLLFSLDFHYSDTWADPGHQAMPSAWTGLTFAQLLPVFRAYNSNTIAAFAAVGAMPDYVQIGNEITGGMLWPLGQVPGTNAAVQWSQFGQLLTNAVQGIRDAAGARMPKIIIHIDLGGDWSGTQYFFDNVNAQNVAFDIIGESYYPFYHGPLTNLNTCLSNAAARYGKPIIVAETAFPWNNTHWTTNIFGFVPSTNGQVSYMAALAQIVKSVTNQLGAGVFYWGAEYQAADGLNEAGFNTASFFDSAGNVLPVADAVGGLGAPLYLSASRLGPNLLLQWPFSGAATRLMTSTNLALTAVWSPSTNSVTNTGPMFTVTLPRTNSAFFRLQSN